MVAARSKNSCLPSTVDLRSSIYEMQEQFARKVLMTGYTKEIYISANTTLSQLIHDKQYIQITPIYIKPSK